MDLCLDTSQHPQFDTAEPDYIDLQTRILHLEDELASARKKLAVTQTIYRNLESDYVSLTSRTTSLVVIPGQLTALKTRKAVVDDIATSIKQAVRGSNTPADHLDKPDHPPLLFIRQSCPPGVQDEAALALDALGPVIHVSVQEDDVCNKFRGVLATLYPTVLIPQLHIVVAESNRKACVNLIASLIAERLKDDVSGSNSRPLMASAGRQRSHTSVSSISSISRRTSIATSISQPFTSLLKATDGISLLFYDVSNIGVFADLKIKLLSLLDQSSEIYADLSDADLSSLIHHNELKATSEAADPPVQPITDSPVQEAAPVAVTASPAVEVVTAPPSSSSASPVITAASPPTISGWASIVRGGSSSASTPRAATQPASKSALPAQNTAAPASAIQVYRDSDTWQKKNTKNRRMSEASSSTSVSVHRRAASHSVGSASAAPATHFRNGSLSSTSPPVRLDPNVSLCKQKKPPCNQHYLTKAGCHNPKCNYSHAYQLSDKQLDEMRTGASKTPCVYRKQGQPCSAGADCVFGHVCPQGSKCKQLRCHFSADMH